MPLIDLAQCCRPEGCIGFYCVPSSSAPFCRVHHYWLKHSLRRWNLEQILWRLFKFCACIIASLKILNILEV